jgi:hypothetical protein
MESGTFWTDRSRNNFSCSGLRSGSFSEEDPTSSTLQFIPKKPFRVLTNMDEVQVGELLGKVIK